MSKKDVLYNHFSLLEEKKVPKDRYSLKPPITSYGIIIYTLVLNEGSSFPDMYFLLGRRRDTIAYSEFLKNNLKEEDIPRYIKLMSIPERQRILKYQTKFSELWVDHQAVYKFMMKFDSSFYSRVEKYQEQLSSMEGPAENPWGFPKGRKHKEENEKDCALRETEEETGIKSKYIELHDIGPYSEKYIGYDGQFYESVYYIGYVPYNYCPKFNGQKVKSTIRRTTVSNEMEKLRWFKYDKAAESLDLAKTNILSTVRNKLRFDYLPGRIEKLSYPSKIKKIKRRKSI